MNFNRVSSGVFSPTLLEQQQDLYAAASTEDRIITDENDRGKIIDPADDFPEPIASSNAATIGGIQIPKGGPGGGGSGSGPDDGKAEIMQTKETEMNLTTISDCYICLLYTSPSPRD